MKNEYYDGETIKLQHFSLFKPPQQCVRISYEAQEHFSSDSLLTSGNFVNDQAASI